MPDLLAIQALPALSDLPTQACMRMFGRCVANGAGGTANSEFRSPNEFGIVPEAVGSVIHSPSTTKRYLKQIVCAYQSTDLTQFSGKIGNRRKVALITIL